MPVWNPLADGKGLRGPPRRTTKNQEKIPKTPQIQLQDPQKRIQDIKKLLGEVLSCLSMGF